MTDRRPASPLRVAIVGAGPAAFYAAEGLLKQTDISVTVDMFERLPTPFGLVRYGVAPDHQRIKTVTRTFARTARQPGFRFFGNVEVGRDISIEVLRKLYHQVVFATGAQTDRRMNVPGEDLGRSHAATEFVAWYNGHPDYRDCEFDLSHRTVAVVGVGNVALDVARILCLTRDELLATDMADHAIDALCASRVEEIHVLGRRGPAQAAFTNPELKELGDLAEADVLVRPEEAELEDISREEVVATADRTVLRKVELIQDYASRTPTGKRRRLWLRFLVSPQELLDDGRGEVGGVRIVRNRLVRSETGTIAPEPTGRTELISAGLVFRSVGYRGVPIPGLPFDDRWGVILNKEGRVLESPGGGAMTGFYTAGWIKRGPSGVIGTNRPCSVETVAAMLEDAAAGATLAPANPAPEATLGALAERSCRPVGFDDWERIDAAEVEAGAARGRPRLKLTSRAEMLQVLAT